MEKITGNEPAQPIQPTFNSEGQICDESYKYEGLTIRQHFAAMAMQGYCANPEIINRLKNISQDGKHQSIAETALKTADALIAELNK